MKKWMISLVMMILMSSMVQGATWYPSTIEFLNEPPADFPETESVDMQSFSQVEADYGIIFPDDDIVMKPAGDPVNENQVLRQPSNRSPITVQFTDPVNVFGMYINDWGDHDLDADASLVVTYIDDTTSACVFQDPDPTNIETGLNRNFRFFGVSSDKLIKEIAFGKTISSEDGFFMWGLKIGRYSVPEPAVEMEWVTVDDAGNATDDTGYGSVSYIYRIGKYEVTNGQYCEFLNAVAGVSDIYNVYDPRMNDNPDYGGIQRIGSPGSYTYLTKGGRENWPIVYISFYDALRFANWMHNGKPTGLQDSSTTEDGAYTLTGQNSVAVGDHPIHGANGRNARAEVWLTSEDEWYKAAYYKGGGTNAGYWDYPTQSDSVPDNNWPAGDNGNSANWNHWYQSPYLTNVGAYTLSGGAYGTFDQTGNVWEWNEAVIGSWRGLRGGSCGVAAAYWLPASNRVSHTPVDPADELDYGFRVASAAEPAGYTWHTCNGHRYALTLGVGTWDQAEAEAVAVGGHLVTINDANEHAWLGLEFEQQLDQDEFLWIGFYQDHDDPDYSEPAGGWKWISGEPVTYLGWDSPEPTNHSPGEDYGTITGSLTNHWNDWGPERPDFYPIHGIIEISEPAAVEMEWVTIGNAGNPGDTRTGIDPYSPSGNPMANPYGCGAVGYEYQIGKYEVTNAQWNAFTSAAGVPTGNPSNAYDQTSTYPGAQQPTNEVSWYEAAQFCNYLTSGDKSQGVYLFSGNNTNPGDFLGIDRTAAQATYGTIYFLPTENEWYKAAYYKPDGSGYSSFANGLDTMPVVGGGWNYYESTPWNVGTGTEEQNGTFDMMGNVWEITETLDGSYRSTRGGSFYVVHNDDFTLASSHRHGVYPYAEAWTVGFRVARDAEPACTQLFFDDFTGSALDKSLWSVFVDKNGQYHWPYVSGGFLHSRGYHTRIDSIPTFAAPETGQSVKASASICLAGDIQKFGFAPNPNERPGPISGYYFDTVSPLHPSPGQEDHVRAVAWFQPASGDFVTLLDVKIYVTWYEFHEFTIERTPSEVIYSIDCQEVARVAHTFAGALPVGVWNDRSSMMLTDWVEVCSVELEPPVGPVAYWSFDDVVDPGHDDSGNGHNGTVYGAVSAEGVCNNALSFDGVDDIVDFGNTIGNFGTDDFSVVFWFRTDTDRWETVMGKRAFCGEHSFFELQMSEPAAPGHMYVELYKGFPSNHGSFYSNQRLDDNQWHLLAITRQGVQGKLYIDGVLDASRSSAEVINISNSASFLMGNGPCYPVHSDFFSGELDEVRIYDRALSASEIAELMDECSEPVCEETHWVEEAKLVASDAAAGDYFGYSVALSGTTGLVGAHYDDAAGTDSGSAYLYDFNDPCNIIETKLTAFDANANTLDEFGWSMALSGATALVGARYDDDAGSESGSAYLFDVATGSQIAKLTASDAAAYDQFGWSVALSGTTALVGARGNDDAGSSWSGSAYLYDFSDPCNIIETKLTASDAADDQFGYSVAISGTTALVGAPRNDDAGYISGSAYLYDFSDPCSIIETKLTASDAAAGDQFGWSVALSGTTALVGARLDDLGANSHSGSAYLFDVSDPCNITEIKKLTASDAAADDQFGYSVAISGSTALVGARGNDDAGLSSGSAYLYDFSDPCSIIETKLTAPDAAGGDQFGTSVAISGTTALVGAPLNDDAGSNSGSAYVFENVCIAEPILPDLEVTSEDLDFIPLAGVPNAPVTISATIWNFGWTPANNVEVVFKDFDTIIGSQVIPSILPGEPNTVSIEYTWGEASFRLITVTADPCDAISELDETNNSGSKVYQVGDVPEMDASIEISCSAPAGFPEGSTATISGQAIYNILIDGQPNYEYPVKGGSVTVEVFDCNGVLQELIELYTDTDGRFGRFNDVSFDVPCHVGDQFEVVITITDGSLTGTLRRSFNVIEFRDLWVRSSDITFSDSNPDVNETITIGAVIHASGDNTQTVFNVPVTIYAHNSTLGTSETLFTANIGHMPPGDSCSVSTTWTKTTEDDYCIEVVIGPGYSDDNNGNNRATRCLGPPPMFRITANPRYASVGQVVRVTVNAREPLPSDQLDSITVTDSAAQDISVVLKNHVPGSTRWVYHTEPLPEGTALGTATITVTSTDSDGITHSGNGYFVVVEIKPDLWVYSEDIDFTDENPDLGETITIDAMIHAHPDNIDAVVDVPVSFYAHHGSGESYQIGRTLNIEEMFPGDNRLVSTTWRNAAEGPYIIEVEIGPGFSDDNNGNNQATRELVVGNRPPVAVCQDVTVEADSSCQGLATPEDVDGGSFDPDGDAITLSLDPPGPYLLGDMIVTLTVSDGIESATCEATVTVVDATPPVFTIVPQDMTVYRDGNGNIADLGAWLGQTVVAEDTCGNVNITNDFMSGPNECGNTGSITVTWTATDECDNNTPAQATFTIVDPTADVTYDGDLLISTGGEPNIGVNLIATLWDDNNNVPDIDGEEVTFTLNGEGVGTIVQLTHTISGVATAVVTLEPAIYTVNVSLGCSDFTASAILVVYNPEGGFASGAGQIMPADDGENTHPNARARFGFEARYKEDDPTGHIKFRYFDRYMELESDSIEQLVITGGRIVQFKGWATVNGIPGNWFFVKGIDNGDPGRNNDTFEIKVWHPGVSEEGDPSERAAGVLQAGNIVVQAR